MEVWDIFRDCKSGIDFENTVVKFLRCLAFEANRTGKDDGGIDIVATTSILSTKYTFYIQCKYFNTPLGKHPIQEVYAGTNYYGGNGKPVVITNNKVTVDARVYGTKSKSLSNCRYHRCQHNNSLAKPPKGLHGTARSIRVTGQVY